MIRASEKKSSNMPKYIITQRITGWGDVLCGLVHALAYADKFKRTLVVNWSNSCYLSDDLKGKINAFLLFFKKIKDVDIDIISDDRVLNIKFNDPIRLKIIPPWKPDKHLPVNVNACDGDILNNAYSNNRDLKNETIILTKGGLNPDFLSSTEKIKYYGKLQLKDEINNRVLDYISNNSRNKDYEIIGVHLRHGNAGELNPFMLNAKNVDKIFNIYCHEINNIALNISKEYKLFVSTDSPAMLKRFKSRFDNVIHQDRFFVPEGKGSHPVPGNLIYYESKHEKKDNNQKYDLIRIGEEALIDMWLLSYCDHLIHNRSEFVLAPIYMTGKIKNVVDICPRTLKVSQFRHSQLKEAKKPTFWTTTKMTLRKIKTSLTWKRSIIRTIYKKVAFYLKWRRLLQSG